MAVIVGLMSIGAISAGVAIFKLVQEIRGGNDYL